MTYYRNKEIRIEMLRADITNKQLAKALGYHPSSFSRLLQNVVIPSDEKHIILHAIDELAYGHGDEYVTDRLKKIRFQKGLPKMIRRKKADREL